MHIIQQKILELSETKNLANLTLREIGEAVGDSHPQKIKHHLNQLFKKGFLKDKGKSITRVSANSDSLFYFIPIMGSANCGKALTFADNCVEGYLTVSRNMLHHSFKENKTFAVKAVGNSMNKSSIRGISINDGDYAIIDAQPRNVDGYKNKYVLSIIDGMANIKKFAIDKYNEAIVLLSESTENYPPIYIHTDDFNNYMVNGIVTDVIKNIYQAE